MIILAINTAIPETSIALLTDTKVITETSWSEPRTESQRVLPAIDELLTQASISKVVELRESFSNVRAAQ